MNSLNWYPVVRFPIEKDLLPLLKHLDSQQILHHVTEEEGEQQLWIADEPRVLEVAEYATEWLTGGVKLDSDAEIKQPINIAKWISVGIHLFSLLPVTLISIVLGYLGALLVFGDSREFYYIRTLMFQPVQAGYFLTAEEGLASGQFWRLITPVFIHFGFLHILFNSLFLWVIGRRIELAKGSVHFLLVVIVIGVLSNTAQYLSHPNVVFGGLSGVVYGVLGYVAVYQHYLPHPLLQFHKSVIIFFIVWLLLGVFGVIDLFISGNIANRAHVVGLLSGAIIGWIVVKLDQRKLNRK
ncbi:MAG: rhomboid family intramembrane serine protease [Cellvibrionaceae bacterium]